MIYEATGDFRKKKKKPDNTADTDNTNTYVALEGRQGDIASGEAPV